MRYQSLAKAKYQSVLPELHLGHDLTLLAFYKVHKVCMNLRAREYSNKANAYEYLSLQLCMALLSARKIATRISGMLIRIMRDCTLMSAVK